MASDRTHTRPVQTSGVPKLLHQRWLCELIGNRSNDLTTKCLGWRVLEYAPATEVARELMTVIGSGMRNSVAVSALSVEGHDLRFLRLLIPKALPKGVKSAMIHEEG